MKKRKNEASSEPASEGAPEWMVTYSDMVTLLMCFFVLLFSMATVSTEKFEQVNRSLQNTFNKSANAERFDTNKGRDLFTQLNNPEEEKEKEKKKEDFEEPPTPSATLEEEKVADLQKLEEFERQINEMIIDMDLGQYVSIHPMEDSIILRINSIILFDLGSANVKNEAQATLTQIGLLLGSLQSDFVVQGHTDNLPINTPEFPSNWELSTKRSTNIVKFFIERSGLSPSLLTATGNAEFEPVAPNDSLENRLKNRRIDIVIPK